MFAASFHAVAFSIIFKKQLNTIMKSGVECVESLLRKLKLEDRRISHSNELDVYNRVDYRKCVALGRYIEYSKEWLGNAINTAN